jgi:ATP-dependent Clp protease ATP-binding subunit ClpE
LWKRKPAFLCAKFPEFLNRIDAVIRFKALEPEHLVQIVDLMVDELKAQLQKQGILLEVTQAAKEKLAQMGFDPKFGARPLRRVLQDQVEDAIAENVSAQKTVEKRLFTREVLTHFTDSARFDNENRYHNRYQIGQI